jgi:outer membrane protein TolC
MDIVRRNSPQSVIASNIEAIAEAGRDAASGIYDPFLQSDFLSKNYKEKNYFNLGKAELSQFTPFGLSVNAGLEHNTGVYVNPENNVPLGGLGYLGVEMPLLNGLLTDERRNELDLAENNLEQSRFEMQARYNQLGEDASEAYWLWWRASRNLQILDTAIRSAQFRVNAVRRAFSLGYKPAMDTLDAINQLFLWRNEFASAYADYISAKNNALLYAGTDSISAALPEGDLVEYVSNSQPDIDAVVVIPDSVAANNPVVRTSDFKIRALEIERELKEQKLLPKLNAKYNLLAEQFDYGKEADKVDNLFTESIKWGLKFEYPLFITQARNELEQNSIKIELYQTERDFKAESVRLKIESYLNEIKALRQQINNYEVTLSNYRRLVELERIRYDEGGGSLFLINYREFKLYEAAVKLVEYKTKMMLKMAILANLVGEYKITDIINE